LRQEEPLNRRQFLSGFAAPAVRSKAAVTRRPNIILIVTDDQRYDAFSASGYDGVLSFLKTPNLEGGARDGAHFRNTFVTFSLCTPSRASILTGQYVHTHGVNALGMDFPRAPRIFPQLLQEAGYDTGFVGKWHIGRLSEVPNPAYDYWAAFRGQGAYFDPLLNVNGVRTPTKGYVTDVLTDRALEFLGRKRDRPFFLHLSHKAPHDPVTPPPRLASLYEDASAPYPRSYYEPQDDKPAWYLNFHDHDAFHYMFHPHDKFEKYVKDYCRTLKAVDESLGRILRALDESGEAGNTVILYMADNGHFMAEHQFFSKMIMYEESIRIPLIVRDPRSRRRNVKRDEFALNVDIAPTILDLAGVSIPKDMEGRSLRPLIEGRKAPGWRKSFLYEYEDASNLGLPQLEGVRTADGWQYARYPDWEQLYNLHDDPLQMRNLARDPRFAARKSELMQELRRLGGGRTTLKGPGPYKRRSQPAHTPHAVESRGL
jgi:N-acetylglucosamine-6-sulfatase